MSYLDWLPLIWYNPTIGMEKFLPLADNLLIPYQENTPTKSLTPH